MEDSSKSDFRMNARKKFDGIDRPWLRHRNRDSNSQNCASFCRISRQRANVSC